MNYAIIDTTPNHILVRFEDESLAQIPYKEDWTSDELNDEIVKYIPDIVAVIDGEEVVIPRGEYNEH